MGRFGAIWRSWLRAWRRLLWGREWPADRTLGPGEAAPASELPPAASPSPSAPHPASPYRVAAEGPPPEKPSPTRPTSPAWSSARLGEPGSIARAASLPPSLFTQMVKAVRLAPGYPTRRRSPLPTTGCWGCQTAMREVDAHGHSTGVRSCQRCGRKWVVQAEHAARIDERRWAEELDGAMARKAEKAARRRQKLSAVGLLPRRAR